jgi:hypothetical protein
LKDLNTDGSSKYRASRSICLEGSLSTQRSLLIPFGHDAFRGRGHADYFGSHDLEDFITVIDGRLSLLQEVEESSPELRGFLAEAVRGLLAASRFLDALPGHLSGDAANPFPIRQEGQGGVRRLQM